MRTCLLNKDVSLRIQIGETRHLISNSAAYWESVHILRTPAYTPAINSNGNFALQYYMFYLRFNILLALSTETNLVSNALFQKFALISFYAVFFSQVSKLHTSSTNFALLLFNPWYFDAQIESPNCISIAS